MKKCKCKAAVNCPMGVTPTLQCVYPDGTPIWRDFTPEDGFTDGQHIDPKQIPLGAAVARDGKGGVIVVALAIDPDRAVAYVKSDAVDGKCRFEKPPADKGFARNILNRLGFGGLK